MNPFPLAAPERRTLRQALACAAIAGLAAILLLALSGWFLTGAAIAGAAGAGAIAVFNYLIPSAAIRGLAILRTAGRYGERLLSHQAALTAMADLRGRLFGKLAAQDSRTAPDLAGGDASARLIGDIEALEDLIVRRPGRPASLVAAIFAVALVALAGWKAALALALLLAALPPLLTLAARRLTTGPAAEAAEALGALRTAFVDYAAARPEIIAYGLAPRVADTIAELSRPLDRARAALARGDGAVAGLLAGYGAVTAAVIFAVSDASAPIRALALLAAAAAVEAMAAFARTALRQASVAQGLARLATLADLPEDLAPPAPSDAVARPIALGSHQLAPGTRVAITGISGSGKTRLIEALAGLRAPVHMLALDGIPIEQCSAHALRSQFALAPQDAVLIAGSVADNLRVARPGVTEAAMHAALYAACLETTIAAMPAGLATQIAESGGTLSGGERKRLALARALLAERPWLLLDEPSEGLDSATESELVARIDAWLARASTGLLLVSHRRAPLALASQQIEIRDLSIQ
ncbi:ATP-binding cassette domain-containing protein [Sphingomonas pokkalii]|uniref:ABC transporter n=1 Tax=Sphingomonas pokkalii TaxID=2175090 RepID=A0A2U0SE05_9SPHN|nr:ATP-binding cassette domain-containing protein [Sphingomonas pokkalii]PVX29505.1 ABC transporter [Sphingomonas pokkalii]